MPPRNAYRGCSGPLRAAFLWLIACGATPLAAQELPLQRDYPGLGPFSCPPPAEYAEPDRDSRTQAGQLASDASQAVILGELLRAQDLLDRATQLDPASPDLAYSHARVFEELGRPENAMAEYCRALSLGAVDAGILDSQERIDALYEIVQARIPTVARAAFSTGLTEADAGRYDDAIQSFSAAVDTVPDWAPAVYDRAVLLERVGRIQESLVDYRRYLDLMPNDIDPVVSLVTQHIGTLEGLTQQPTPSPGATLALGSVFPGMGQYYTGRGVGGTLVLGLAAAAVTTGFVLKKVTVQCLTTVPSGQDCPADKVYGKTTKKPYLLPALGTAGAVTVIGAIEAFVRARGRRHEAERAAGDVGRTEAALRISGPKVTARGGRVDVSILALKFR